MKNKTAIKEFLNTAYIGKRSVKIGFVSEMNDNKSVITRTISAPKVKDYIKSFEEIYDDNLKNKVFPKLSIFAVKYDDGVEYSLKDVTFGEKKEKKVTKNEENDNKINYDEEI